MGHYGCPWRGPAYDRGVVEGVSRFRLSLLDDHLRPAYYKLWAGLISMEREIDLGSYNEHDVNELYNAVKFDDPTLPNVVSFRFRRLGNSLMALPTYGISKIAYEDNLFRMREFGDRFLQTVSGSSFERELTVHDHLAGTVAYHKGVPSDFSAIGPLLHSCGACEGVSKAVLYLLRICGVDAGVVTGETTSGELHAWNMVYLDGRCYHLDVTWDLRGYAGQLRHDYLNVNDSFMRRSRTWQFAYPSGIMDANYYSRRGIVIYRMEDLGRVMSQLISRRSNRIEYRISDALMKDFDAKTAEQAIRDALSSVGGRYSGSYRPDTGCSIFDVSYHRD